MEQNSQSNKGGQSYRSSLLLFLAASIWGVAFVAQSVGMDYMGPFTFNGARSLIGGMVLLPLIAFRERNRKRDAVEEETPEKKKARRKVTLIGGCCCGLAICTASMFQQYGIQYTTVGKAGFITTLYIIIVPIMGLFFGKKVRRIVWAGVMSCGVAYTLQIIGQRNLDPTVASLILSLESVVSVLAGWVILNQTMSSKEIFGCVLVFAAVILVQLPEKKRQPEAESEVG